MKAWTVFGKRFLGMSAVLLFVTVGCTAKVTPEPIVVEESAPVVKEKETTVIEKPAPVVKEETTIIEK